MSDDQTRDIPVPELLFPSIDEQWHQFFLVLRKIPGRTLDQAWATQDPTQRLNPADTVTGVCERLATAASDRMETLDGKGVREDWLTKRAPPTKPSWKPHVQGPLDLAELKVFLDDPDCMIEEARFFFCHIGMGPSNLIVDDEGRLTAVIDWESAAYYPRFWIATKPLFSAGYNLRSVENVHRGDWATLLSRLLAQKGFTADEDLHAKWQTAIRR